MLLKYCRQKDAALFKWDFLKIRIINLIVCTSSAILYNHKMDMTGRWASCPLPLWHCPLLLGKRPGLVPRLALWGAQLRQP